MRKISLLFSFLFVFSNLTYAQEKSFYLFEGSPNFSIIPNLRNFKSHKLSFNFSFKAEEKISSNSSFLLALSLLNTGARRKNDYQPKFSIIGLNYLTTSVGAKHNFNNFYISGEIGASLFLFSNSTEVYGDEIITSIVWDSRYFNAPPLSPIYLMNLGYEFEKKNNYIITGIKGYLILDKFEIDNSSSSLPYGIGAFIGLKWKNKKSKRNNQI